MPYQFLPGATVTLDSVMPSISSELRKVTPKRCGHTKGKTIVSRDEAVMRIQAAVDARNEAADILIMARTVARATNNLEETIIRAQLFHQIGANINFLEAPESIDEIQQYCLQTQSSQFNRAR